MLNESVVNEELGVTVMISKYVKFSNPCQFCFSLSAYMAECWEFSSPPLPPSMVSFCSFTPLQSYVAWKPMILLLQLFHFITGYCCESLTVPNL